MPSASIWALAKAEAEDGLFSSFLPSVSSHCASLDRKASDPTSSPEGEASV
jgi:hypothetical protein